MRKKSEAYFEILIEFIIIMSLVMTLVAIWQPFIAKQNLDYMAKVLVRDVEANGEVSSSTYALEDDLKTELGINPTVTWSTTGRIQLRDRFSVTVSDTVYVEVIRPTFTDPVTVEIPMSKTLTGVSQVLWRDGE